MLVSKLILSGILFWGGRGSWFVYGWGEVFRHCLLFVFDFLFGGLRFVYGLFMLFVGGGRVSCDLFMICL